MFGLEKQKKKKPDEFIFDLEKDLKGVATNQDYKRRVETRIQTIREVLRKGDSKDDFDKFGLLLHGYTSLLKVFSRLTPKA